jgi:Glycosyl hydrolase catalytic core
MKVVPALMTVLLLALAPVADAKVPPRFMGVNWDSAISRAPAALQSSQLPRMKSAGVRTVRTAFFWAAAQPEENGPVDLSATDAFVGQAAARHIEVFPHIITAPDWARMTPAPMAPPSDPQLFVSYVRTLVSRYGPDGTFWAAHPELPKVPIRYWQFWNEPHLPFQWDLPRKQQKYWPRTYVAQLKVFYQAVKAQDPSAKVVLAGLANTSWQYMADLYKAGAAGNFDVAAIHPYTTQPRGVVRLLAKFRAVMKRHHDARMPLWVTELGLPASKGRAHSKSTLQTTPRGMAAYLTGAYRLLRARAPRVYWYTWASEYRGDIFRYTGLFRYRGGRKQPVAQPAYRAYVKIARKLEGK